MADIVVGTGRVLEAAALQSFLDAAFLRLYVNVVSGGVTVDTVLTNLVEATFPGYAAINTNSWGTAFYNSLKQGEIDEINRVFTLSTTGGPYPIYGYYLTVSGVLYAVGPNPSAPIYLANTGDSYVVQPRKVQGDLC